MSYDIVPAEIDQYTLWCPCKYLPRAFKNSLRQKKGGRHLKANYLYSVYVYPVLLNAVDVIRGPQSYYTTLSTCFYCKGLGAF